MGYTKLCCDGQWALLLRDLNVPLWEETRGAEPCLELHFPQREPPGKQWQFCRRELIPEYSFHCSNVCSVCHTVLGHVEIRCMANRSVGLPSPAHQEVVPRARQVAVPSSPV